MPPILRSMVPNRDDDFRRYSVGCTSLTYRINNAIEGYPNGLVFAEPPRPPPPS